MENKYKISVVIPIYNSEDTIERAVNSILNQKWDGDVSKDVEIICVDDCSTDSTLKILKDLSSKYENVQYYSFSNNSGLAGRGRNKGIELSKSDYIVFLDSDDEFLPEGISKLYSAIISDDVDLVVSSSKGDASILDPYNKICPKKYRFEQVYVVKDNPKLLEKLHIHTSYQPWGMIFNKNFLIKNNIKFREDINFEDYEFSFQCLLALNKMKVIPNEQTYMYYSHEESMTHTHKIREFNSQVQVLKSIANSLSSKNIPATNFLTLSFDILYLLFFDIDCSKDDKKVLFEELRSLHKEFPSVVIKTVPIVLLNKPILENNFEKAYKISRILRRIYHNKLFIKAFRDFNILKNMI